MRMLFTIFLGSSLLFSCRTRITGLAMCHKLEKDMPYGKMIEAKAANPTRVVLGNPKSCEKSTLNTKPDGIELPIIQCEPNYVACMHITGNVDGASVDWASFFYDKDSTDKLHLQKSNHAALNPGITINIYQD